MIHLTEGVRRAGLVIALSLVPGSALLPSPVEAQDDLFDLTTLFELGGLVTDSNTDGVPDRVNASLVVGASPRAVELSAAAEIAARLGFETMAMDLPVARGAAGTGVLVVVGRSGVSEAALSMPPVTATSLDAGEGVVAVHEEEGRQWVLVLGGDDQGLLAAARLFAGVLPHTRNLSDPTLSDVMDQLREVLAGGEGEGISGRVVQARTLSGGTGLSRLVVELEGESEDLRSAVARLREGTEADTARFDQTGLAELEIRAGTETVRVAGRGESSLRGPVSGRPGSGAKDDMDLSNLFTSDGLLGDTDSNLIPDRIDAQLAPGDDADAGLVDLAARLGLESTGLVVPLVAPATEIDRPASSPTLVLTGLDNPLTRQLADSGRIDLEALGSGEGLVQVVPRAFGEKPALVVTGADSSGASTATRYLATRYPNLRTRGKDRPTLDEVERRLWSALAGHAPEGQAAIGLYKLDRIMADLDGVSLDSVDVLMSVDRADAGLESYLTDRVSRRVGPGTSTTVRVDDRDVRAAGVLFDESPSLPSELERFRELFEERVLPGLRRGEAVRLEARISEPPELRRSLEAEVREALVAAGADPEGTQVRVLSAFKQGYSWLHDVVRPRLEGVDVGEVRIRFRRNVPPPEWTQQAMHTPVRWLHEIYPIDEVLARDLDIDLDRIVFEQVTEGPTYEVEVTAPSGAVLLEDVFEPKWVIRPYFDRFRDYEQVRVATGWMSASSGGRQLVDERIRTDPEAFWDYFQADVLPALYDHVMELHEGLPEGGDEDAPYFGALTVEVEMSEPDYRLGVDNEIHATLDALHEEIYFGTLEFFELLGRNSRGRGLSYPGRVLPVMRPRSDGSAPSVRVRATGFATSRPAVVVTYRDDRGVEEERRLDIPRTTLERPSARLARIRPDSEGLAHVALRVRVDTEFDMRDSLLNHAPPRQVDRTMVSAEQVTETLRNIEALRAAGLYASALAMEGLGTLQIWAEWTHREDPERRRSATLAANGSPPPLPDGSSLVPQGWRYGGERLVQWDEPIPPPEGHEILGKMAAAFDEASVYRVGESYLGRDIWAMDLMSPVDATHWSHAKATTYKPTVVYSAREHANEVSSTSHVLRHAELILTDSATRAKLDRVNVVVHPFTNPDGAQLAYDLYQATPDYLLHAGYLGALGQGATSGSGDDHPIYPEAPIRQRLWDTWLPDVFLNPHGYPSHQVVQLFSEYSGLVRRGRVTERNWGMNKGWFMPGFGYVDSPRFPRHKDAAFHIRDYITDAINGLPDVMALNRRAAARYERYGARWDPDVFRIPLVDGVLIEMPLKGSSGDGGYNPRVTIWSGLTEAPDETAYGPYLQMIAGAGLAWDRAILDYLADGEHDVERSGSSFDGGVGLRMHRPRPPEPEDEEVDTDASDAAAGPGG